MRRAGVSARRFQRSGSGPEGSERTCAVGDVADLRRADAEHRCDQLRPMAVQDSGVVGGGAVREVDLKVLTAAVRRVPPADALVAVAFVAGVAVVAAQLLAGWVPAV